MKHFLILIFAVGLMSQSARAAEPTPEAEVPVRPTELNPKLEAFLKAVEPAAGDNELRKKLKERHNSAVKLLELRIADYKKGLRDLSVVFEAAHVTAETKLDLAENVEQRGTVLEQSVELAKTFEGFLQKQVDSGVGSKADLERARFARLSVEVQLLKLRQKE